jgi:hypothetical protein
MPATTTKLDAISLLLMVSASFPATVVINDKRVNFNLIFLAGSSPISISSQGVLNRTGRCNSLRGCWVHL